MITFFISPRRELKIQHVWKCRELLSWLFDVSSNTIETKSKEASGEIVKNMLINIRYTLYTRLILEQRLKVLIFFLTIWGWVCCISINQNWENIRSATLVINRTLYHLMALICGNYFGTDIDKNCWLLQTWLLQRCVSCNKKTIVNVIQNIPLIRIWVNLHFCCLYSVIVI